MCTFRKSTVVPGMGVVFGRTVPLAVWASGEMKVMASRGAQAEDSKPSR